MPAGGLPAKVVGRQLARVLPCWCAVRPGMEHKEVIVERKACSQSGSRRSTTLLRRWRCGPPQQTQSSQTPTLRTTSGRAAPPAGAAAAAAGAAAASAAAEAVVGVEEATGVAVGAGHAVARPGAMSEARQTLVSLVGQGVAGPRTACCNAGHLRLHHFGMGQGCA